MKQEQQTCQTCRHYWRVTEQCTRRAIAAPIPPAKTCHNWEKAVEVKS